MIGMIIFWLAVGVGVWWIVYKAMDLFGGDD